MDDVTASLHAALARADVALADADALVRAATPRWDGVAAARFGEVVAEDLASVAAARAAVDDAWRAALAHGRAADESRAALLTAAGVSAPTVWGVARRA